MKFHDPGKHDPVRRAPRISDLATFEIGRSSWNDGIVVEVHASMTVHVARAVMVEAFERAGAQPLSPDDICTPGWWAVHIGAAAMNFGPTRIQRVIERGIRHTVVLVSNRSLAVQRPDWPLVRFAPTTDWYDLRGEAALRHGPSVTELAMYREAAGVLPSAMSDADLVRAFEDGVLEWMPGEARGRLRGIRAAGA